MEPKQEKLDMDADNSEERKTGRLGGYVRIKVVDQSHGEIEFKIKMHVKMGQVMRSYCRRLNLDMGDLRFMTADHDRVLKDHTPEKLKLEDGDIIEAYVRQYSGAGLTCADAEC